MTMRRVTMRPSCDRCAPLASHSAAYALHQATLCAFVGASQSLDAPVIDLADDCVTLKTPKGDQRYAHVMKELRPCSSIHIDHVQPSSDLTSRELLPSIASEVLSGRNATVLCVDAGGDSASWLLGRDAHHQYAGPRRRHRHRHYTDTSQTHRQTQTQTRHRHRHRQQRTD